MCRTIQNSVVRPLVKMRERLKILMHLKIQMLPSVLVNKSWSSQATDESETDEGSGQGQHETESETQSERERNQMPKCKKKSCWKNKEKRHQSVEQKLDRLSDAMLAMQDLILKKAVLDGAKDGNNKKGKSVNVNRLQNVNVIEGNSETTNYHDVLEQEGTEEILEQIHADQNKTKCKRGSSSSECQDTSDELIEVDFNEQFIAECTTEAAKRKCKLSEW